MKNKVNPKLVEYIETEIFPIYETFDKGHDLNHILSVIKRSFEIYEEIADIDINIVYACAALHDIGIQKARKNHALYSSEFVKGNSKLRQFFSDEEIEIIANAVEDHSTSKGIEPRSIYGKIVCDADKDDDIEVSLLRAYEFTKRYFPDYTEEECYRNVYEQLVYKFGPEGKVKYWINSSKQQEFVEKMRLLAQDETEFNNCLKEIVNKKSSSQKVNRTNFGTVAYAEDPNKSVRALLTKMLEEKRNSNKQIDDEVR